MEMCQELYGAGLYQKSLKARAAERLEWEGKKAKSIEENGIRADDRAPPMGQRVSRRKTLRLLTVRKGGSGLWLQTARLRDPCLQPLWRMKQRGGRLILWARWAQG